MVDDTVKGLLGILGTTAFAATSLGCVLYAPEIVDRSIRVGRFLHILRPLPPMPDGAPLERIASDLRRLQPEARRHRQGTPQAKYRGVVAAYDDVLLDACRALEIPTPLAALPEGLEREAERMRVEFALEQAGVRFQAAS
jgi:hypothetical protein